MPDSGDTIFAVASGAGRAAVTLLRLSGPACAGILTSLSHTLPPPRRATLRHLRDGSGETLDHAIVLWLPGPASHTGEDVAELHLHGGAAVLSAVSGRLVALGARPAEAGEFSRRAFLNGRIDLLQAEAVADLVAAETEAQRRQALRQMEGALGTLYCGWTTRLTTMLAGQEALIDFPDEDLPDHVALVMLDELAALRTEVAAHLGQETGERLREGLVFAITGPPNAGKSTLINALADRDVAIVSATPGTTRDVLEARVELAGVPVTLLDTAGLRDGDDPIEAEGVRRARARAAQADLVIALQAADAPTEAPAVPAALRVTSKIDLGPAGAGTLGVSASSGEGMTLLRETLARRAAELTLSSGPPPLTRARHRAALSMCVERLQSAGAAALPELRAEDLRLALRALGSITGSVGVEQILDSVFRQFCIGK